VIVGGGRDADEDSGPPFRILPSDCRGAVSPSS